EIKEMLLQHTPNIITYPYIRTTLTISRPLLVFTNPPTKLWESLTSKNFEKKPVRIYITTKKGNKSNTTNLTMEPTAICRIGLMEIPFTCHNTRWPSQTLAIITILIFALTTVKKIQQ
ncbi:11602_t:CDS:1, partial [Gigaspora rosea]